MYQLYFGKGTIALSVHIALEELGVPYEPHLLNTRHGEAEKPEYRAINPKGRVPSLITEKGTLTEAAAILTYLAETHKDAELFPSDPFEKANALSFCLYLASTVHVNHAHMRRWPRWTDDEEAAKTIIAKVPQNMADCAEIIETHYLKGPWVLGDNYSFCDPYLFTIARWLPIDDVPLEGFPEIKAHYDAMHERPAVQRALKWHE